jgi:hypothetical protein
MQDVGGSIPPGSIRLSLESFGCSDEPSDREVPSERPYAIQDRRLTLRLGQWGEARFHRPPID